MSTLFNRQTDTDTHTPKHALTVGPDSAATSASAAAATARAAMDPSPLHRCCTASSSDSSRSGGVCSWPGCRRHSFSLSRATRMLWSRLEEVPCVQEWGDKNERIRNERIVRCDQDHDGAALLLWSRLRRGLSL